MDEQASRDARTLAQWIGECPGGGMVFFGGAGVSTESGIPDFRGSGGIYTQKWPYPPEVMLSRSFFESHPREFFEFYCSEMMPLAARPNAAHTRLAALEETGTLAAVITQNIDGLHQAAGATHVLELHGSIHRNFCMSCGAACDACGLLELRAESSDGVPRCSDCGGIVKPDVVLYEEPLDEEVLTSAVREIAKAQLLVVAGTSLAVQPAAGLIGAFRGTRLVIVNRDATPADGMADLCIHANVGEVLSAGS